MQHEPQSGLGRAVQAIRKKAGIDQAVLAERADLPESLIAEIESGKADPAWGDVRRVAVALNVTLERLSELAEEFEGN